MRRSLMMVLSLLILLWGCGEDEEATPDTSAGDVAGDGQGGDSDGEGVDATPPCSSASLMASPMMLSFDGGEGVLEGEVTVTNTGEGRLCFEAGGWALTPEGAPFEVEGPEIIEEGASGVVTVRLLDASRGRDGEASLTWATGSGAELEVALTYVGRPLTPEDVSSPDDLQRGESFIHLVMPDGSDQVVHTRVAGHEAVPKPTLLFRGEGESTFELRLTGVTPMTGVQNITEVLLSGDTLAILSEGEVPATAQIDATALESNELTGAFVSPTPLAVPIVQGDVGSSVEIHAIYFNKMVCLGCELCFNGIDDDMDGATDCDDDDCAGTKACGGAP